MAFARSTVKLEVDPHTGLADHVVDFIELYGAVSLSLAVADATVDAANDTLSWSVSPQPWNDGDKLMVRIREGLPYAPAPEDVRVSRIACVKGQHVNRHIEGSTIVIEAPAFEWFRRVYWTLDSEKEGNFVLDDKNRVIGRHRFLIATMTHELGHALGLPDFRKYDELKNIVAIMNNDPHKYSLTITAADLKQLWKIYRGHAKAPH